MPSIEEVFGHKPGKYSKQDIYGLELEIEDQREVMEGGIEVKGWSAVQDGSLRNFGMEYISSPPVALKDVQAALETLFGKVKITEASYSENTSIHVHCNMLGMDMDNLKSFCLLYLVTEKLFFDFVDKERYENVFCVPLMDFTAPFKLFEALKDGRVTRVWTKYSALNLLPLTELGTVEFRHMHGTNDVGRIVTWVTAIDCLKQACKAKSFGEWRTLISSLNTSSEYGVFLASVFGPVEKQFLRATNFDYYKEMLYENVMRAKLWEHHEKTHKPSKELSYEDDLIQATTFRFEQAAVRPGRPFHVWEGETIGERFGRTGRWCWAVYSTLAGRWNEIYATDEQAAVVQGWIDSRRVTLANVNSAHFVTHAQNEIARHGLEEAVRRARLSRNDAMVLERQENDAAQARAAAATIRFEQEMEAIHQRAAAGTAMPRPRNTRPRNTGGF